MPFSCNTCRITKDSIEEIKEHYKADLHVFNSKRRSKNLPPASEEEFCKLASRYIKPTPKTNTVATPKPASSAPQKTAKKTALNTDNVVKISKQVAMAISNTEDNIEEDVDEEEEEGDEQEEEEKEQELVQENLPMGPCISIFDNKEFDSVESCIAHMSRTFGFFIPDSEYIDDLEGLLEYLGEKVKLGGTCLYCQRRFRSGRACQHHMAQLSHCKLRYEEGVDLEEFEDFYDFSASYEDVSDDAEEEGVAEISAVTGELVLPDGRTLGHRDFRKYYKQYYRTADERVSVQAQKREELLKLGAKFSSEMHSAELVETMSDLQVQAALVKHYKMVRKSQIAEQRGMLRRLAIDQKREYKSKIDAARSTATITAKIRDYHKSVM